MASRIAKKAAKKAVKATAKNEVVRQLSEVQVLKLRALSSQARAADMEIRFAQAAMQKRLAEIDPQGEIVKLNDQINALVREARATEMNYRALVSEIGNQFKIDMAKFVYDDLTGILSEAPEAPSEVPAAAPAAVEPAAEPTAPVSA